MLNIEGVTIKRPIYEDNIELYIKADSNDADYISETNIISIKEFEEVLPILRKILNYKDWNNWEDNKKYLTDDEIMLVSDYIPYCEYGKCHSVEEIKIWYLCSDDSVRHEVKIKKQRKVDVK